MKKYVTITAILIVTLTFQGVSQLNKGYFFNQARNYLSQNEYTKAIGSLNVLIGIDSTIAEAWFLRGLAKYNLNDLHGSQSDFSKAIKHNPVFSQAYHYRGVVFSRFSRYSQAQLDYNMAIDLRPNSSDAYYSRGINYLLMQDAQKAIEDFSQVIKFNPRNVDAWINRGTAQLLKLDSLSALADFDYAIMLNPLYADAYSKRGRLYLEMNSPHAALDDFNKATELDTSSAINFFLKGLTNNKLGNNESALANLNQAIELAPDNALAIYNRALIHWQMGNNTYSLRDFDKVSQLNPDNLLVYYNRAILLYEQEEFDEAIIDFTHAIDIFPDFAKAYLGRSAAYAQMGNYIESQMDKSFAQSIAERYSKEHLNPLTDTTESFRNLISFSSDFSSRNAIPLLEEYNTKPIDILPFMRVVDIPTDSLKALYQPFTPLDTINDKLKVYSVIFTFSSKNLNPQQKTEWESPFLNFFFEGIRHSEQKRFNEAVSAFENSLEHSPNNPLSLINLAAEKADMVSFIAAFNEEINPITLNQSTRRRGSKNINERIQIETFGESLEILEQLNTSYPNHPIIYYNMANIYALAGEVERAHQLFSKAIENNPNFAEAWYNRGLISLMIKDTDSGCFDLGKAGELGIRQAYLLIHRFCRR